MTKYSIETWVTDAQIEHLTTSDYWNNEQFETSKQWYNLDGDFKKLERHLSSIGLASDLDSCVHVLGTHFRRQVSGVGIDLAAGNLWAAPYLLKIPNVRKLLALEFSRHRLLKLGPALLDHYQIPADQIPLVLGSFYDLHLDDASIDFVFMSSAFHHAENPRRLLDEIRRVLKRTGVVIIIGEQIVEVSRERMRHAVKFLISKLTPATLQLKLFGKVLSANSLLKSDAEIFQSDPILGDQLYSDAEYASMFITNGFTFRNVRNRKSKYQSFVLIPT